MSLTLSQQLTDYPGRIFQLEWHLLTLSQLNSQSRKYLHFPRGPNWPCCVQLCSPRWASILSRSTKNSTFVLLNPGEMNFGSFSKCSRLNRIDAASRRFENFCFLPRADDLELSE